MGDRPENIKKEKCDWLLKGFDRSLKNKIIGESQSLGLPNVRILVKEILNTYLTNDKFYEKINKNVMEKF